MKQHIKHVTGRALFASRLNRWLLRDTAVVACFHRVRPGPAADSLTLDVAEFERYCRFFSQAFNVVPLRELVGALEGGRRLESPLAITFDDGYADNFLFAAPVLRELRLPATFFVVSQWMGTEVVAWWDRKQSVPQPWMTWDEVRILKDLGFDIGAHTRTHADLGAIEGEQARDEIAGCRADLEAVLGTAPDLFAYPYGRPENITEANRRLIREAGFRCCCSAHGGVNGPRSDPFRLFRVPIASGSPHEVGFELALGRTLLTPARPPAAITAGG